MKKGKVKEYDPNRGCGVVIDQESKQQHNIYANYIFLRAGEELKEGQDVEFEIENNRNRDWVVNLRIILG
ncbi:MAG: hypothetical protein AB7S78_13455 [Candidatus Omnitrophota bacterium]